MARLLKIGIAILSIATLTACGTNDSGQTNNQTGTPSTNNTVTNQTTSQPGDNSVSTQGSESSNTTELPSSKNPGTSNSPVAVANQDAAIKIVQGICAQKLRSDPGLKIEYDHSETENGETVYVIHVFDIVQNTTSTVAWIGVRSDGLVQDWVNQNGWVSPQNFVVK